MLRSLLLLTLSAVVGMAQPAVRFDDVMKAYSRDGHFMGSVLVAKDGAIVFEKSVGWANAEWQIANSATTKFRIGSLTKSITATAILLLNEQGKLTLDDPLSQLLPSAPVAWGAVTVRQLLTHTSGVPSFTSHPEYKIWKLSSATAAEIVARIAHQPLDFAPGEKYNYSNTGYLLLGWIVEAVSGKSYENFFRESIFQPLGMKDSGYDSVRAVIPQRASGYDPSGDGPINAAYVDMHVPGGAGGLYSTTGDLLKYTLGVLGGKLLKPESLEQMTTPVKNGYGFGLGIGKVNGRRALGHSGAIEGFVSHLAYYPDDKVTVIVLANLASAQPDQIATKLAAVEFGEAVTLPSEHTAISVARSTLERYVGKYALSPTFILTITREGDQLQGQATGQSMFPLLPEAETKFFVKAIDVEVEFVSDAAGSITHLVLTQGGRPSRAGKLP